MSFNLSSDFDDVPMSIAVDADQNVYVGGYSNGASNGYDYLLIKYDSIGDQIWHSTYNSSGDEDDILKFIQIDNDGFILAAGFGGGNTTSMDAILIKYDPSDGDTIWKATYNNRDNTADITSGLHVDYLGQSLITGRSFNPTTEFYDIFLVLVQENGIKKWDRYVGDSLSSLAFDSIEACIKDYIPCVTLREDKLNPSPSISEASVYYAAPSLGEENRDIVLMKYDTSGTPIWQEYYDGPESGTDISTGMSVDTNSAVILSAYIYGEGRNEDFAVIQYDSSGTLQWVNIFDGIEGAQDAATDVKVKNQNVYVTGLTSCGTNYTDIITFKFENDGDLVWEKRFESHENNFFSKTSIAVSDSEEVYVSGISKRNNNWADAVTIKYSINDSIHDSNETISDYLNTLALGLLEVSKDTVLKALAYSLAGESITPNFYFVFLEELFQAADSFSIDLWDEMNQTLNTIYETSSVDYVGPILDSLDTLGLSPFFYIPYYELLDSTTKSNEIPLISYKYGQEYYPFPCIDHASIDSRCSRFYVNKNIVVASPTWILVTGMASNTTYDGDNGFIWNLFCLAKKKPNLSDRCKVCPTNSAVGGTSLYNGGFNMMDKEFRFSIDGDDECISVYLGSDPNESNYRYARISKLPEFDYYTTTSLGQFVKKIDHPLRKTNLTSSYCDGMDLCDSDGIIWGNSFDEDNYSFIGLAWGGVFSITRPYSGQKPLYLAYPNGDGIWFSGGYPDMAVKFGFDFDGGNCSSGERDITENNWFDQAQSFASTAVTSLAINSADVTNYLYSTDLDEMQDYWLDNVITVAIFKGNIPAPALHVKEFYASNSQPGCTPGGSLEKTFAVGPGNSYEVFYQTSNDFDTSENMYIKVQAKFANGETIDACQTVSMVGDNYTHIQVLIRGKIKNYDPSDPLVYKVQIYR